METPWNFITGCTKDSWDISLQQCSKLTLVLVKRHSYGNLHSAFASIITELQIQTDFKSTRTLKFSSQTLRTNLAVWEVASSCWVLCHFLQRNQHPGNHFITQQRQIHDQVDFYHFLIRMRDDLCLWDVTPAHITRVFGVWSMCVVLRVSGQSSMSKPSRFVGCELPELWITFHQSTES